MTQKEALQVLALLKAAYPQFYKDMNKQDAMGTANVWAIHFADVPADIVLLAINKHISSSDFPPTISQVKKKFSKLHWEAYEALRVNDVSHNLSEEEVRFYKYIKDKTENERYMTHEPKIREMIQGNNYQMLLGGGNNG